MNYRVALVHDYLSQDGGAERVLKALHEIWPQAPIFVLFHNKKKIQYLEDADIRESFLKNFPFGRRLYQWYLPWMPLATESHDLKDFDVVISASSMFSKGIITGPNTLHISYCHTPPRFLWADNYQYVADLKAASPIKWFLRRFIHKLRLWDKMSVDRVDHFIANSKTVRQRINKYYRRDSDIIYPPVNVDSFTTQKQIESYYVAGGRLVPYKRIDLVINVFNRLKWHLKIFGVGPELPYLKNIAKPNIEFLGSISDQDKTALLSRARALIHPQEEDLGITAIESMASGRPVIAYSKGGATETVVPEETGVFFHKQNWESLYNTLINFNHEGWDSEKIRDRAKQFDTANFKQKMNQYVTDRYEEFARGLNQGTLIRESSKPIVQSQ